MRQEYIDTYIYQYMKLVKDELVMSVVIHGHGGKNYLIPSSLRKKGKEVGGGRYKQAVVITKEYNDRYIISL